MYVYARNPITYTYVLHASPYSFRIYMLGPHSIVDVENHPSHLGNPWIDDIWWPSRESPNGMATDPSWETTVAKKTAWTGRCRTKLLVTLLDTPQQLLHHATSNRLRMAFLAVGFHSLALKHPVCALASRQLQPKAQRLKVCNCIRLSVNTRVVTSQAGIHRVISLRCEPK